MRPTKNLSSKILSLVRAIIIELNEAMRLFQKLIYYICFLLYKWAMRLTHHEIKDIWFRHSFCFDYWKFLKSDIDITIFFERTTKDLLAEIAYTHKQIKRFIPVIGEFVIFNETHKDILLNCVNTLELNRDPTLVKKYSIERQADHYEKILFLHKFLVANWNKDELGKIRPEKLNYFSDVLELGPKKKISELIDDLSSLLGVDPISFKEEYIKQLEFTGVHYVFDFSNIIYCLFYNQLCYMKPLIPLSIGEKKVLEKTLLWELWGCYSYQANTSAKEIQKHFLKLNDGLIQLTGPEFSQQYLKMSKQLGLINP